MTTCNDLDPGLVMLGALGLFVLLIGIIAAGAAFEQWINRR